MNKKRIRIYLFITFLEALLVAGIISGRRVVGKELFFSGFTAKNLLMLSAAVLVGFLALGIFLRMGSRKSFSIDLQDKTIKRWRLIAIFALIVVQIKSAQSLLFVFDLEPGGILPEYYLDLLSSLLPFFIWGVSFSLRSLILIANSCQFNLLKSFRHLFRENSWLGVLILMLAFWFGLSFSNLGYWLADPQSFYWAQILKAGLVFSEVFCLLVFAGLWIHLSIAPKPMKSGLFHGDRKNLNWLVVLGVVAVGLILLGMVRLNFGVDPGKWKFGIVFSTNAPLLGPQMIYILLILIGLRWIGFKLNRRWKWVGEVVRRDVFVMVVLWTAAFFLWRSAPIAVNDFVDIPRAPTFEHSVSSDSLYYEIQAHRLIEGEGLYKFTSHSFYSFLLGIFHLIGGDHFLDVIGLQTALLALTPFWIYKLGTFIQGEKAGWLAGILYLVREYNALLLGDTITVMNTQTLMTEPLTQLLVVVILYFFMTCFSNPEYYSKRTLLIGSLVGLMLLTRMEMISLLLVILFLILVINRIRIKDRFKSAGMLLAGTLIVVLPWMTRNYFATGTFYLDKEYTFMKLVGEYFERNETEGTFDNVDTKNIHISNIGLLSLTNSQEFILDVGPFEESWNHFRRSAAQSVLYLPSLPTPAGVGFGVIDLHPDQERSVQWTPGAFRDQKLTTYVKQAPYWRIGWDGRVEVESVLPVLAVLFVVCLGVLQAWKKRQMMGIMAGLFGLIHLFVMGVMGRSGGRYIHEVDWIPLLYYAAGLSIALQVLVKSLFENQEKTLNMVDSPNGKSGISSRKTISILDISLFAAAAFVGISMPVFEALQPPLFDQHRLLLRSSQVESFYPWEDLEPLLSADPDESVEAGTVLLGKALYPRFYTAEEGVGDDRGGRIPTAEEPRLIFYLVGTENVWVSLPRQQSPESLPHSGEVVVLGRLLMEIELPPGQRPYFQAERIYLFNSDAGSPDILLVEKDKDSGK